MSKKFKGQVGVVTTLAILLGGGLVGYGRLNQRVDHVCAEAQKKADREPLIRELDTIQKQLTRIEDKLDAHLSRGI